MIISFDTEKALHKLQHPFMIKTWRKSGIEGPFLNLIKNIENKPTANITFNDKNRIVPTKIGNKARKSARIKSICCTPSIYTMSYVKYISIKKPTKTKTVLDDLVSPVWQENEIRGMHIREKNK